MNVRFGAVMLALTTALLTACGGSPEASPPSSPAGPAAASVRPASVAASVAPNASAQASLAASAKPSQASASSSPASGAPASAAGAGLKLTIAPNSTQVDIQMRELLAGNAAQTDAVESSKAVSGSVELDGQGGALPGSKITLDLGTLTSDRTIRDNFIKRVTLQTNQFPTMDFVPKQVQGLSMPVPTSGQASFKLLGDATIKGVTKPMSWDVTATFTPQGCQGEATSSFKLSDFGMTPPKAGPVISVDDAGKLEVKFQASRSVA